jgi:hypothetical protein
VYDFIMKEVERANGKRKKSLQNQKGFSSVCKHLCQGRSEQGQSRHRLFRLVTSALSEFEKHEWLSSVDGILWAWARADGHCMTMAMHDT